MAAVLAIVQFALVPILLAVALAVRFAGVAKPLNIVDYARVADPVALHRWAGNRLLLLPAAFLVGGFVRAPWSPNPVAGRWLRVYLGAHNSLFKPNPLRGSA